MSDGWAWWSWRLFPNLTIPWSSDISWFVSQQLLVQSPSTSRSWGTGAPFQLWVSEGLQSTFMVKHQHPASPLLKTTPFSFFWLKLSVLCLHRQAVTGEKWSWHCWVLAGWEPDWSEWALCSRAHNSPCNGPVKPQPGEASEVTNSILFNSATSKNVFSFLFK